MLRNVPNSFEYLTPRIRLTPKDLQNTKLDRPSLIHFICSPTRAGAIISEVDAIQGWKPITVYEPIPVGGSICILEVNLSDHFYHLFLCKARTDVYLRSSLH